MIIMKGAFAMIMMVMVAISSAQAFTKGEAHITTETNDVVKLMVEFAITPQERARGLMGRESLAANEGMIFLFPNEGLRRFWMKDTPLSLDILFFDKNLTLISAFESAEPNSLTSISSLMPAQFVLEIPAGSMEKLGLSIGDQMRLFREN